MSKKTILSLTFALLICCGSTSCTTTPAVSTTPKATTPVLGPPGWEEYATPISVPELGISSVAIDYAWVGWGERQLAWVIEKTDGEYRTDRGESMDAALVSALKGSLTNLRRSGSLKSCLDHTDDYPHFRIDIVFEDGSEVTLLSDSNCPQNVPWNVVYDENLYIQYSGEIPTALRTLLDPLVGELLFLDLLLVLRLELNVLDLNVQDLEKATSQRLPHSFECLKGHLLTGISVVKLLCPEVSEHGT